MTRAGTSHHRIVTMIVQPDGSMTVSVDGLRLLPAVGMWARESYAEVVDHATANRRLTVEVEIREADGSVFADVIRAATRTTPSPAVEIESTGAGFLPGEPVAVAPVAFHDTANAEGGVRTRLEKAPGCDDATEVVFFGRTSGTISVSSNL